MRATIYPTGLQIRIARVALGVTQGELARAAGCSTERLSQIERGYVGHRRTKPSPALLDRIVAALINGAGTVGRAA